MSRHSCEFLFWRGGSPWLAVVLIRHYAFAFLNRDGLTPWNIREFFNLPAGPLDFNRIGLRFFAQAEGQHKFALREIT